jgi:hypothetical protein
MPHHHNPHDIATHCRKRRVNQALLVVMMEMGIPKHKAEVALAETGNVGVEVATEWLFSAPDTQQFEQNHYPSDTGACFVLWVCPAHARAALCALCVPHDAATPPTALPPPATPISLCHCRFVRAGSPSSNSSACSLDEPCVPTPKRVPLKGVRHIAAGAAHTLAVTAEACYSWGHGQYGALGHGEQ